MVFWNCQITCSFCYPPYPDGDRVILLLAAAVKWENTARSGDAARGTVGTNLIRAIEWGKAGSDALKLYRIVGYRGIVERWRAEYLCVSGVIVNKCLLFFLVLHLSTIPKHLQILSILHLSPNLSTLHSSHLVRDESQNVII